MKSSPIFIKYLGVTTMIKNYFTPNTIEEAVSLKETYGDRAKYLSGGTELNLRINKEKYETFIDLRNVNSREIKVLESGSMEIGAGVTFQDLVSNENVPYQLKRAAQYMDSRNVRNIATIGGNIGSGRTMGDLLPTLLVLEAKVKIGESEKLITVEDYIHGRCDGLIEKIIINGSDLEKSYGSRAHMRTSNDISIIGAAVTFEERDGKLHRVKIALGGVDKKVIRLREVEGSLEGKTPTKEEIVNLIKENINPLGDVRGSKEFKTHMAAELVAESFGIN